MIHIESFSNFIKHILVISFILYIVFEVFHYFYPNNYCEPLGSTVIENSEEDILSSRRCVMSLVCEIGKVEIIGKNTDGLNQKNFTCIRKIPAGVWRW